MCLHQEFSTAVLNKDEQRKTYLKVIPNPYKVSELSCAYRFHEVAAVLKNAFSNHKQSQRHCRSE